MANYDSSLTGVQIESALTAVNGLISASNNGKVIVVQNGALAAKSASEIEIGTIEALSVTANGTYTHSGEGGYSPVTVNVPTSAVIQSLSVTENGTYTVPSGVDGYSPITVNVSGGGGQRPFAFLHVKFNKNASSCYITNGTVTQYADSNSDEYVFYVPSSGTWTVYVIISGYTFSTKTVSITESEALYEVRMLLPSDYQEVEYLKFNGGQYINPNIVPTNHAIEAEIYGYNNSSTPNILFGSNKSEPYKYYGACIYKGMYYYGTINSEKKGGTWYDYIHSIKYNYGNTHDFIVDDVTISTGEDCTLDSNNLYIGYRGDNFYLAGRIHRFKIIDKSTGNIVRDFVPCYRTSDSVKGLYDIVNNVFYTNSGSGSFDVGKDVT